jgi:flagellar basal body-associated protein FliL
MAEDEGILEELEGAEAPGGKKKMGMIIGIIVGLLVLGGGGYYAYTNFFKEKPADGEETKETTPVEEDVIWV